VIRRASTGDIPRIEALMKSVAGFWDESWRPDVLERALGSVETLALVHEENDNLPTAGALSSSQTCGEMRSGSTARGDGPHPRWFYCVNVSRRPQLNQSLPAGVTLAYARAHVPERQVDNPQQRTTWREPPNYRTSARSLLKCYAACRAATSLPSSRKESAGPRPRLATG
jgi:hypothetical protein